MSPASRSTPPAGSGAGRSSTGRSTSTGERPDEQREYQLRVLPELWHGTGLRETDGGNAETAPAGLPHPPPRAAPPCRVRPQQPRPQNPSADSKESLDRT